MRYYGWCHLVRSSRYCVAVIRAIIWKHACCEIWTNFTPFIWPFEQYAEMVCHMKCIMTHSWDHAIRELISRKFYLVNRDTSDSFLNPFCFLFIKDTKLDNPNHHKKNIRLLPNDQHIEEVTSHLQHMDQTVQCKVVKLIQILILSSSNIQALFYMFKTYLLFFWVICHILFYEIYFFIHHLINGTYWLIKVKLVLLSIIKCLGSYNANQCIEGVTSHLVHTVQTVQCKGVKVVQILQLAS